MSARGDSGSGDSALDTSEDTGSGTDSTDISEPTPEWFRLDATVTLVEGQATQVEVRQEFLDGQLLPVDCVEDRSSLGIVASVATPDPTVYHWWRVSLGDSDALCVELPQLPEEVFLGMGALHPEVEAQLLGRGLDAVADSLYGAYVMLDEAQVELKAEDQVALAYGFAGTESDLTGDATARTAAPLPDGDYTLSGVFLFPLMDAE